jgi:hypothetical protein
MKLIEEARLLGTGWNARNYMVVFFFFLLFFEVVVFVSWLGEAKEIVLRANASPRAAIMSFFIFITLLVGLRQSLVVFCNFSHRFMNR